MRALVQCLRLFPCEKIQKLWLVSDDEDAAGGLVYVVPSSQTS